jgi:hypothetical protein
MFRLMTFRLCKSGASAEASPEAVQFEVVPPIAGERSFDGEQL